MKSNEIVQEGPIDFAGKLAAGTAGFFSGGTAGASAGYQQKAQEQQLNKYVSQYYPNLNATIVNLKAQGVTPGDMSKRIQAWATKYFGIQAPPPPPGENPKQMQEWLKKVIAQWLTRDAEGPEGAPTPGPGPEDKDKDGKPDPKPGPTPPGPTPGPEDKDKDGKPDAPTPTPTPAPAPAPAVDPGAAMFTDPAKFKAEWDKYVAAKSAGGVPYRLMSDPENLAVFKSVWKYGGGVRAESKLVKRTALTEAMLMEDPIYRSFKSVGRMIVEKKMTEKEILDLFGRVEQGVTAGGSNRTLIGKGKDAVTDIASAINKAYQGVADKISRSGPVSGADQLYDKLTDKLADAAGGQSGAVMSAIKKYREFAQKHPIMQGAIYAILIALTGISGAGLGGAAILGGIKMADKLLLGNKLSSSLWSGFVTGATAYGVGQAKDAFFGGDAGGAPDTAPAAPNLDAETAAKNAALGKAYGIDGADTLDQMNAAIMQTAEPGTIPADYSQLGAGAGNAATDYTVQSGDTLSQIAQQNNMSVQDLMQANPDITNPDVLNAGQSITIPDATGDSVYQGGVGTNADTMAKIASGEYTDSEISQNLAKGAAQGTTDAGGAAADATQAASDAGGAAGSTSFPNHPGTPEDWAAGKNPPPDWVKDSATGKYSPPSGAEAGAETAGSTSFPNHPGTPEEWAAGKNPPPDWVKDSATGKYSPPSGSEPSVVTPGSTSDGSYQQAAPLGPDGQPMKQVPMDDAGGADAGSATASSPEVAADGKPYPEGLSAEQKLIYDNPITVNPDGTSGTVKFTDGTQMQAVFSPPTGPQPRLPPGSQAIEFPFNGKMVTGRIVGNRVWFTKWTNESKSNRKPAITEMANTVKLYKNNDGMLSMSTGHRIPVRVIPEGMQQPRLPARLPKVSSNINGHRVTVHVWGNQGYVPNFKMESVVFKKRPISEMIDKKATVYKWALNESLGRKDHKPIFLTTSAVGLVFENIIRYQNVAKYLIKEAPGDTGPGPDRPDLPDEMRPDMPDSKQAQGFFGKAMSGLRNFGKQFTTKVTAEKLKMNWHVKGKPTESDELWQFLLGEGVPQEVLADVWKQLEIPVPAGSETPAPTPEPTPEPGPGPTPSPAPTATGTIFDDPRKFRASFEAFADSGKNLPIQVKAVIGDILKTALRTVESLQKKAKMARMLREAKELKKKIQLVKETKKLQRQIAILKESKKIQKKIVKLKKART